MTRDPIDAHGWRRPRPFMHPGPLMQTNHKVEFLGLGPQPFVVRMVKRPTVLGIGTAKAAQHAEFLASSLTFTLIWKVNLIMRRPPPPMR